MTKNQQLLLTGILMAAGIFLIILLNFLLNQPPDVVPESAPETEFSAQRASQHHVHIASEPNPLGSEANQSVRSYITAQLLAMGLEPELHQTEYFSRGRAATLNNIVVRIPGKGTGKTVLFMGHYDTVIVSPGASDNGGAVVSLLEVIRMLQHHPTLENDLIFLFSDGEEFGLLGAKAFMAEHPWAKMADVVVNLEAMGTTGQSIMFETGNNNLKMVREFARAVPYPTGNSLSMEIYKRMPNYTDFEVFKTLGYQGLNFAYIGDSFNYHTPGDNIENTDLRSVQHHGSNAASLALYLGNSPLDVYSAQDAVYFNTLGYGFVSYPYSWVPYITLLILLVVVGTIGMGIYYRKINVWRMITGLVSYGILLLALYVIFNSLFQIIAADYPDQSFRLIRYHQQGTLPGFGLLAAAFSMVYFLILFRGSKKWHILVLYGIIMLLLEWSGGISMLEIGIALAAGIWLFFAHRRPAGAWDMSAGALVIWAVVAGAAGFMAPGASYLFAWPLLFGMGPLAIAVFGNQEKEPGLFMSILFLVFAIPVLAWFPVLMNLFQMAMGINLAGVIMVFAGLMVGLLIPHIYMITRRMALLIPAIAFAAGLYFLISNTTGLEFDYQHRKSNQIVHAIDGNTGENYLFTFDKEIDQWTAQFLEQQSDSVALSKFYPYDEGFVKGKKTGSSFVESPALTIVSDSIAGNERMLKINVKPDGNPEEVTFFINAGDSELSVKVGDLERQNLSYYEDSGWYRLSYLAPPDGGINLTFFTRAGQQISMHINEVDYMSLPDFMDYQERPPEMMSGGDYCVTSHLFRF